MKKIATGRAVSMPAGLAMGNGVSIVFTLLVSAILAKLVDAGSFQWENIGYAIGIMLLLGAYLGAVTAYKKVKRQRFLVCAASGCLYFAVLLAITALFFGGQFEAVGVTCLIILGGSLCASLIPANRNSAGGKHKVKVKHR